MNSESPSASAGNSGYGAAAPEGSARFSNTIVPTAKETATKLKEAVGTTATRAKEEIGRLATDKKENAASQIGRYGTALHETAESLQEKDPNIAWFAHSAADKLEKAANYMRERDFPALRHDAEEIARRHPAAFFGGLFLVGLVLGNVVKASRRKLDDRDDERDPAPDRLPGARENDTHPATLPAAHGAAAGI